MSQQTRIAASGVLLCLAVGAGAFGAHALQGMATPRELEVWQTAVLYHLVHGLGLLVLAALEQRRPTSALRAAWALMLLGIVLFSGSLYLLVLTDLGWVGPVTPFGGVALMLAWLLVAWGALRGTSLG